MPSRACRRPLSRRKALYSADALFIPMKALMEGRGPMPSGESSASGRFTPTQCNGPRSEPENNAQLQLGGIARQHRLLSRNPRTPFQGALYLKRSEDTQRTCHGYWPAWPLP